MNIYNSLSGWKVIKNPFLLGDIESGSDILPFKDNYINLGSPSKKYANVYAYNLFQGSNQVLSQCNTPLSISGDTISLNYTSNLKLTANELDVAWELLPTTYPIVNNDGNLLLNYTDNLKLTDNQLDIDWSKLATTNPIINNTGDLQLALGLNGSLSIATDGLVLTNLGTDYIPYFTSTGLTANDNLKFDGTKFIFNEAEGHSLNISGDITTEGDITVVGNISFAEGECVSLITSGLVRIGGTLNVLGITNLDVCNINVCDVSSTLNVVGAASFEAGINTTTLFTSGLATIDSLTVVANATIDSLTVVANGTIPSLESTTINNVGTITTDVLVVIGSTNLEGSANITGSLTVEGVSNLAEVNSGDINITGILDTTGTATFGGETTINGALLVDGTSTMSNLNAAEINCTEIINTGNTTIDGTLNVFGISSMAEINSGDINITGAFDCTGTGIFSGDLTCNGALLVDGSITSGNINCAELNATSIVNTGNMSITGNETISGTLEVSGLSTFANINTTDCNVGGVLDVSGNTTLSGTLEVIGASTMAEINTADCNVGGVLDVSGNTTLSGTCEVVGNTTLSGTLEVIGASTMAEITCGNINAGDINCGAIVSTTTTALEGEIGALEGEIGTIEGEIGGLQAEMTVVETALGISTALTFGSLISNLFHGTSTPDSSTLTGQFWNLSRHMADPLHNDYGDGSYNTYFVYDVNNFQLIPNQGTHSPTTPLSLADIIRVQGIRFNWAPYGLFYPGGNESWLLDGSNTSNIQQFLLKRYDISGTLIDIPLTIDSDGRTNLNSLIINPVDFSGTPDSSAQYLKIVPGTFTDSSTSASGTLSSWQSMYLAIPTLAATNLSVSTTTACTLRVGGAPIAGTNETITNSYAFYVDGGTSHFGGNVYCSDSTNSTSYATGSITLNGGLGVAKDVYTGGKISCLQLVSQFDNRHAKPADFPSYTVSFGFAALDNNNDTDLSGYADTLALNSYSDSSGGSQNLVMFKKASIGMRIYQGAFNDSTNYFTTYKDAVMQDSSGNVAISNNLTFNTISSGTWNGTTISVPYGGTGATSFTSGQLLVGNGTSALQSYSGLTYNSSTNTLDATNITQSGSAIATQTYVNSQGFITNSVSSVLTITNTTQSTSTSTGSLIVDGGVGIVKNVFIGGTLDATNLTISGSNVATESYVNSQGFLTSSVFSSALTISDTTQSTSTSTGSLIVDGGVGIVKDVFIGGTLDATNLTIGGSAVATQSYVNSQGFLTSSFLFNNNNNAFGDELEFSKSRTGSAVHSGDELGFISFYGTDSANNPKRAGFIYATVPSSPGSGYVPGQFDIYTTDSSGTEAVRLHIDSTTISTPYSFSCSTISSGTWNGTTIGVSYGGTGATSFTSGQLVVGNGTSALQSYSGLTWNSGTNTLDATNITLGGSAVATQSYVNSQGFLTSSAFSSALTITDTTQSTSTSTGALIVDGGVGIAKNAYFGGTILGNQQNSSGTSVNSVNLYYDNNWGFRIAQNYVGTGDIHYEMYTKAAAVESLSLAFKGANVGVGTVPGAYSLDILGTLHLSSTATLDGVVSITNTTQSTSTSSGALIVDGGLGIVKNLYTGGNISCSTISSGTWNGSTISVGYGGTGASSFTSGQILVGNGSSALQSYSGLSWNSSTNTLNITSEAISSSLSVGGGATFSSTSSFAGQADFNGHVNFNTYLPSFPQISATTWTVSYSCGSTSFSGGTTYGVYWKFGQLVYINGYIIYTSSSSIDTSTTLSFNLPVNQMSTGSGAMSLLSQCYRYSGSGDTYILIKTDGTSIGTAFCYALNYNGDTNYVPNGSGDHIKFNGIYIASS